MQRLYKAYLLCFLLFVIAGSSSACGPVIIDIDDSKEIVDVPQEPQGPQDIQSWFDYLCSPELGGRYSGSDGIIKAMNYISDVIGRSDSLRIDSFSTDKCDMNNIIYHIKGYSDFLIVLGAHYDAYGYWDNTPLPGADDNMSGVAVLLKTIKYFQEDKFQPRYSVEIVFFDGEEIGRYGSYHYVEKCTQSIKEYINVDTCGNKDFGIIVLFDGSSPQMKEESNSFISMVSGINEYKVSEYNPKGYTTDCEAFQKKGIPYFFISNDSYNNYNHSMNDDLRNISYKRLDCLAIGLNAFLITL